MKVIGIIAEYNPFHLGHKYQIDKIKELKKYLVKNINDLEKIPKKKLVEQRYQKFRNMA